MKRYQNIIQNLGIVKSINDQPAKKYILANPEMFTPVNDDFEYNGIVVDEKTRSNKGTTRIYKDIHGVIYFIGIRLVWQLEEVPVDYVHPIFQPILNSIKAPVVYQNRKECMYFSDSCNLLAAYGACPSDCATYTDWTKGKIMGVFENK